MALIFTSDPFSKRIAIVLSCLFLIVVSVTAQNSDTANISITDFRLAQGTFSWRGTNTFHDMTSFNSELYTEGHLQQRSGSNWKFIQNYRLLYPEGYDPNYAEGYPLIVMLHGLGERANCWDDNCYCTEVSCNPNTPPSDPSIVDLRFLNNDHNLSIGGGAHLSAVDLANGKLPNDPSLPGRAFSGFVLFPQNFSGWNVTELRHTLRTIRLLTKNLNIDQNRILLHGISNGGGGVYNMLVEAEWLFAGAAVMSGITSGTFRSKAAEVAHIPMWFFQGGVDENPTTGATNTTIRMFREAGGIARYTLYPTLGHVTWVTAYKEPDFFLWLRSHNKANIHVYYGASDICGTTQVGARLGLANGFYAYQWEKDGVIIPGAITNEYIANVPGIYRARFSRISPSPSEAEWNRWSDPVTVGEAVSVKPELNQIGSIVLQDLNNVNQAKLFAPEGEANYYWYKDGVLTTLPNSPEATISASSGNGAYTLVTSNFANCPSQPSDAKHIYFGNTAPINITAPTNFKGMLMGPTNILLSWDDVSNQERGYEIWRRRSTDAANNGWTLVSITDEDITVYNDSGLEPSTTYWYKIRAISNTGRSNYAPGNSKTAAAENLIISTSTDDIPPTPPQNLIVEITDTNITDKTVTVTLNWQASTDAGEIKQYKITYGESTVLTETAVTSHSISGLPINAFINFTVQALDFANNASPHGNQVALSTYIDKLYYTHSTDAQTDIDDFNWDRAEYKGVVEDFDLSVRTQEDFFYIKYYGYLYINEGGNYDFRLRSNDGARLFINSTPVVGRDGVVNTECANSNSTTPFPDGIYLAEGVHSIEVWYYDYVGVECLEVLYRGLDTSDSYRIIPESRLQSFDTVVPPDVPSAPSSLSAQAVTMTQVDLTWEYEEITPVKFEIHRSSSAEGTYAIINRVEDGLNYSDQSLAPGSTYFYKIRTVSESGSSGFSNIAEATTPVDNIPPDAPTELVVQSATFSNTSLTWTASIDNTLVIGYEIWANDVQIGTSANPYFIATNLQPFTLYTFHVVAYDASGNKSAPSNSVTATTSSPDTYYSKANGELNQLDTWGKNIDGSGDPPTSFSSNGLYLIISNRNESALGGNWSVEGPVSRVIIPDGMVFTANYACNASFEVLGSAVVNLNHASIPKIISASSESTIRYNTASTIQPIDYGNLELNGTGTNIFPVGIINIAGNLTVADGITLRGASGNQTKIIVTGDLSFGTINASSPEFGLDVELIGNGTQHIHCSDDLTLFSLKINSNTNITTDASAINLTIGSVNGGGLSIADGATLHLENNTLTILGAGNINSSNETGKIAIDGGAIDIASSSNLNSTLYFDEADHTLTHLAINLSGSGEVAIQSDINITNAIKIHQGDLYTNDYINLLSTADHTAHIQEIENGGRIIGKVKVQRYMNPKGRTYRYISSSVDNVKVTDWQNAFAVTGTFDGATKGPGLSSNPSLFYYSEPDGGWLPYPTTTNQEDIMRAVGYSAFIRNATTPTIINTIGTPYQGDIAFTLTPPPPEDNEDKGWNLLGNPYASTIVWNTNTDHWISNDISSIVSVRNNTGLTGQFQYYDALTNTGTLTDGKIAPGQAFWIQAIGPNPSLVITEKAKSTDQQTHYREADTPRMNLRIDIKQEDKSDATFIAFTNFGTDNFDAQFDGVKRKNEGLFNLSTKAGKDTISLAINNMSDSFCAKTINLNIQDAPEGKYILSIESFAHFSGIGSVILRDNFTKSEIDFRKNSEYPFSVTQDKNSFGKQRFELLINRPALDLSIKTSTVDVCGQSALVTLNETQPGAEYTIYNKHNKLIGEVLIGNGEPMAITIDEKNLEAGINEFKIKASFKGCHAAFLETPITFHYNTLPITKVDDLTICMGSPATIKVEESMTANVTYRWFTHSDQQIKGQNSATLTTNPILEETEFKVATVLPNGCTGPKKSVVVLPIKLEAPEVHLNADTLFTSGAGAGAIQWFKDNEPIFGATKPFYNPTQAGNYSVTLTREGCTLHSSEFNWLAQDVITIFPNPTSSENINFKFRSNNNDLSSIEVVAMDLMGRTIYKNHFTTDESSKGIKIEPHTRLNPGVYLLIISRGKTTIKRKFVIDK